MTEIHAINVTEKTGRRFPATDPTQELVDEALRWRLLMEHSRDGIVIIDQNGQVRESNRQFAAMIGYPHEAMGQLNVVDWEFQFPPEQVLEMVRSVDEKGHFFETRHRRKDGSIYDVEINTNAAWFSGEKFIFCVCRDITHRKLTEKALRESEERFKALHNASFGGIAIHDQGIILDCNQGLSDITGFDFAELIGMNGLLLIAEPYRETIMNNIRSGFEKPYEAIGLRKNGGTYPLRIEGRNIPYHGKMVRVVEFRDITERKQAEMALLEEKELRDRAEAIAHVGSWKLDLTTNHLTWSDEVYRIFGCEPQTFPATLEAFLDQVHPLDREAVNTAYADSLRQGNDHYEIEHRILLKNTSEVRYVYEQGMHKRNDAGEAVYTIGMVQDITERKKAQEQQLLAQFSIEYTHDFVFWIDAKGRFKFVNAAACQQLGYSREELGRLLVTDIDLDLPAEKWPDHFEELRNKKQLLFETRQRTRDGRTLHLEISANYFKHQNEEFNFAFARDITTRKQAQYELEQKNQELEQFVYSASHDLKSPLVTIKTFTSMLRQDLQGGDEQQINTDLFYIGKAADKMQQLLDALLQYSYIGSIDAPAQTRPVNQHIDDCLTALAGILQEHEVQVTGELTRTLHGVPLHFQRIWQNLIENAVKYRGDQPQCRIEIGAVQQAHDVVFYVRDNGIGIDPEHQQRIFNIFSQLNPGSDGSGLGLALVKKIVSLYQGSIWVESAGKGQGSCFLFTLPGALVSG